MSDLVVDTSAAVAILTGEPESGQLIEAMDGVDRRLMSAATLVELGIVLEARFGPVGGALAERFVTQAGIEIVPVDATHAQAAITGWRRFGKGRHPAALNYGDCFTYALAVTENSPVLYLGDDFPQTDLDLVPAAPI